MILITIGNLNHEKKQELGLGKLDPNPEKKGSW